MLLACSSFGWFKKWHLTIRDKIEFRLRIAQIFQILNEEIQFTFLPVPPKKKRVHAAQSAASSKGHQWSLAQIFIIHIKNPANPLCLLTSIS